MKRGYKDSLPTLTWQHCVEECPHVCWPLSHQHCAGREGKSKVREGGRERGRGKEEGREGEAGSTSYYEEDGG